MSSDSGQMRRPLQYSIAALLLLMLVCALFFGFAKWVRDQRLARAAEQPAWGERWELVESSPNGSYRFEGRGSIDQRFHLVIDVTYSMYRDGSKAPIWTLPLPAEETVPRDVFVHNQGWVVTRDAHEVTAITPDGKVAFHRSLQKDVIPLEDLKTHVRWESHRFGYLWSGRSHWYFVDVGETPYFCIRTWWGRRVAVDLPAGKMVAMDAPLREAVEETEKQFALNVLKQAVAMVADGKALSEKDRARLYPVADAAHLASCINLKEAIPLLEKLEPVDLQTNWSMGTELDAIATGTPLPDGVPPFSYGENELRQSVQLALRRLGARPAGYAATSFDIREGDARRRVFPPTARFPAREDSVGRVKKDMKPIEVLEALGPPDYVKSGESWDYDIDAAEPYTLTIVWEDRRVAEIEQEAPPAWQHGLERDRPSRW